MNVQDVEDEEEKAYVAFLDAAETKNRQQFTGKEDPIDVAN